MEVLTMVYWPLESVGLLLLLFVWHDYCCSTLILIEFPTRCAGAFLGNLMKLHSLYPPESQSA